MLTTHCDQNRIVAVKKPALNALVGINIDVETDY